jgi:hypothetical protein
MLLSTIFAFWCPALLIVLKLVVCCLLLLRRCTVKTLGTLRQTGRVIKQQLGMRGVQEWQVRIAQQQQAAAAAASSSVAAAQFSFAWEPQL